VEEACSSIGMPSLATAFFTRAMGRKRLRLSSVVASTRYVFSVAWEFLMGYPLKLANVRNG
jgi:hypothetical protein